MNQRQAGRPQIPLKTLKTLKTAETFFDPGNNYVRERGKRLISPRVCDFSCHAFFCFLCYSPEVQFHIRVIKPSCVFNPDSGAKFRESDDFARKLQKPVQFYYCTPKHEVIIISLISSPFLIRLFLVVIVVFPGKPHFCKIPTSLLPD